MLPHLDNISSPNVHNRAADTLGRFDDNVVILGHLERVEGLRLLAGQVQYSFIDRVRNAVVYKLGQDQAILAIIEHLERVGREGEARAYVRVPGKDGVNMASELSTLVFVDSMGDVGA